MSALGERGSGLRGRLSLSGGGKGEESERAKSLSRSLVKKRRAAMSGDGGGGRGGAGRAMNIAGTFFYGLESAKRAPFLCPLISRRSSSARLSLSTKQNETENERETGGGGGEEATCGYRVPLPGYVHVARCNEIVGDISSMCAACLLFIATTAP